MDWLFASLWLLSLLGYVGLLGCFFHPSFAPLTAMCGLSLGVYLFSLLGLMELGAWVLLGGGFICLVLALRKKPFPFGWNTLAFIAGCLLLYLRYRGCLLTAYDDFSHWGMIVQRMLITGSLPQSGDSLIAFQSYPPGAACWAWYACRFLGGGDGGMLAAQAWLTLAALWPLTTHLGGSTPLRGTCLLPVGLIGLSLFQGTASMMVDNLLATLAIGALTMMVCGKKEFLLPVSVVLAQLCMVKDSGLFLALGCAAVWLIVQKDPWGKRFASLALLVMPLSAVRLSWYIHIKTAFPSADTTRHAMTLANMRLAGADKSYANMFTIAKNLFSRALSLSNQAVQALLLALAIGVLLRLFRLATRRDWRVLVGMVVGYLAWLMGLLFMYIFSMPLSGALELVAFERYNSTFALLLYGAAAVWLLYRLQGANRRCLLAVLLFVPLLIPSWRAGVPNLLHKGLYTSPLREQMQALADQRPMQEGETAVLLLPEDENKPYATYMAQYVFQSPLISAEFVNPGNVDVVYRIDE